MAEKKESFLYSLWKKSAAQESLGFEEKMGLNIREPVENMPTRWKLAADCLSAAANSNSYDNKINDDFLALSNLVGQVENPCHDAASEKNSQQEEANEAEGCVICDDKISAKCLITVSAGSMEAFLTVRSPINGGDDVKREDIDQKLAETKITFGIFNRIIDDIVKFKLYDRPYKIAFGECALNGVDGRILDFYPREKKLQYALRKDGSFDYKASNMINNISQGTVICRLLPTVDCISGTNILGDKLMGVEGKQAQLPKGDNTEIKDDTLVASKEGDIQFKDGKFTVQNVLQIKGDVDNSVGNIDFAGDVVVNGNVREGYVIKAKGSIVVLGVVEGASLMADGGITIQKGINGMNKGVLRTKKGLNSKYLENCTAYVKGDVITESIIYSNVSCEGEIRSEGKHGAVIGGNIVAYKAIKAKVVGSESNAPTNITLGIIPKIMTERNKLNTELGTLREQRKNIEMDVQYLGQLLKKGVPLSAEKQAQVKKLQMLEPINRKRSQQVVKRLEEIEETYTLADKAVLSCTNIWPGVKITIGSSVLNITQPAVNCKYMLNDGEIAFMAKA